MSLAAVPPVRSSVFAPPPPSKVIGIRTGPAVLSTVTRSLPWPPWITRLAVSVETMLADSRAVPVAESVVATRVVVLFG